MKNTKSFLNKQAVSQMEREQIKQRQLEGIREAQKRGKQFGRPKINIPEKFYELAEKHSQKEIAQSAAVHPERRAYSQS